MIEEADWLFRKMVRRFVKERDKVEVEGVTLPGLLVMQKMIREGPQRLGDLAEELDFTSGAVTGLCDKLEQKGFARRIRQDSDRRTVWLEITEQGKDMLDRNRNIGRVCISILFAELSEEELTSIHHLFKVLTGRLEHFSETLNDLAKRNSEDARRVSRREQQKKIDGPTAEDMNRQGKFLSY
ncbi:MarR family winged helix-turn-helix transcriptional regulator [Fontibacillus sp. BL9]|uniref:MarR family winged helix-turn-helix transcriptional regulator n=1 Tax=Fontibacillus sp. BL9 TaxID=3389971 RepID=UPI00397D1E8B